MQHDIRQIAPVSRFDVRMRIDEREMVVTYDGVAIGKVTEDGEVDSVDSKKDEGETDDRTHPVAAVLAEGENESPGGKEQAADEGRIESGFRSATSDILSIQLLLVDVANESDRRRDAVSNEGVSLDVKPTR